MRPRQQQQQTKPWRVRVRPGEHGEWWVEIRRCEYCGARPGERCRTKDRLLGDWYPDRRQPHAARVRAARLRQEEGR